MTEKDLAWRLVHDTRQLAKELLEELEACRKKAAKLEQVIIAARFG